MLLGIRNDVLVGNKSLKNRQMVMVWKRIDTHFIIGQRLQSPLPSGKVSFIGDKVKLLICDSAKLCAFFFVV